MKLLFVLVVLILSQCLETKMAKKTRRPPYIRCFDSSECAPKMCCTMMVGRYKIPVCKPVRKLGAYCNDEELKYHANVTIHFPKLSVDLMDVFENTCPCGPDLYCDRGSRTCQPRSDNDIKR